MLIPSGGEHLDHARATLVKSFGDSTTIPAYRTPIMDNVERLFIAAATLGFLLIVATLI